VVKYDQLLVNVPAVILNIKSFGAAVLIVVALLIAVTLLYRHPTRRCHHCDHRVRLDQRVCRHCGYDFEPIRTTR
jgi:hypothetical protein